MQLSFCYCNDNIKTTTTKGQTNEKTCKQSNEIRKLKTSTILMKNFYTRHEEYMKKYWEII